MAKDEATRYRAAKDEVMGLLEDIQNLCNAVILGELSLSDLLALGPRAEAIQSKIEGWATKLYYESNQEEE